MPMLAVIENCATGVLIGSASTAPTRSAACTASAPA